MITKPNLCEFTELAYDQKFITEAAEANEKIRIPAILQRADAENQNGRVYPWEILQREVARYDEQFVKQNRALGELDHPESTVVNLKNVSHNVLEMYWEGKDLRGTIEILPTPAGNIVRDLMRAGIRIGVSSRGVGSVTPLGSEQVQVGEDFNLICFDIVSNPSTHGAFLNENTSGVVLPRDERLNNLIVDFFSEIGDKYAG
jgi:hypothetical protein